MPPKKKPSKGTPPAQPMSALAICACNNFRRASRAVTQFFDDKLQRTGLRSTQLVILLSIVENGNAGIASLARTLGMDASTLNRNLRPLQQRRLVKIEGGPAGQRKTVSLTDAGRKAIADATPLWKEAQDQIVGHLGEQRYSNLLTDLTTVVDAIRD